MKYRSPSPLPSLPTPPHSPHEPAAAQSALHLLDSLSSFYQQERHWVHHTRAAIELALAKGIDAPPSAAPSHALASPATTPSPAKPHPPADSVKSEPDPDSDSPPAPTRWMRRKNTMNLRLDGISRRSRRRRPHRAPPTEPGARLLEMFAELVDARVESCERVARLVRDARARDELALCCC